MYHRYVAFTINSGFEHDRPRLVYRQLLIAKHDVEVGHSPVAINNGITWLFNLLNKLAVLGQELLLHLFDETAPIRLWNRRRKDLHDFPVSNGKDFVREAVMQGGAHEKDKAELLNVGLGLLVFLRLVFVVHIFLNMPKKF